MSSLDAYSYGTLSTPLLRKKSRSVPFIKKTKKLSYRKQIARQLRTQYVKASTVIAGP